ncbi:MAG TPA: S41 family peptidase [Planktothrix sp.]|jgi:carboxyl-terminal processing protease
MAARDIDFAVHESSTQARQLLSDEFVGGRQKSTSSQDQQGKDKTKAASCTPNPAYEDYIALAGFELYDPKSLGDIRTLENQYACQAKTPADAVTYANKALQVIDDPHTIVLSSDETKALQQQMDGHLSGIGIGIGPKPGQPLNADGSLPPGPTYIRQVYPGSPAEQSGVKVGDMIKAVNGVDVTNKSFNDVANMTRGDKGSALDLTLIRDGKEVHVKPVRADIEYPVVTDKTLPNGIAYIRISNFIQSDVADKLKQALQRHADAKGYIIDVRSNPGGVVGNATDSASMFVKDGTLATTSQRVPSDPSDVQYSTGAIGKSTILGIGVEYAENKTPGSWLPKIRLKQVSDLVGDKPVDILVNGDTASAAELFTAAVHDDDHATVVGTKTYGKGIGQTYNPQLENGTSMAITSMRYYTPKGQWLGDANKNRIGITPDITVDSPLNAIPGESSDVQLNAAMADMNKRLQH